MYNGYSFQEIIVLLLATPVFLMVLVAFLNVDGINNLVLKTSGTSILILYTHDSITEGQWFKDFFRWIFLIILAGSGISIIYRAITHLSK